MFWIFLSLVLVGVLLFWGLPTIAKLASFVSDFRNNGNLNNGPDDKLAPAPPVFSISQTATNSASFKLTGSGEPKAKLLLIHNEIQEEVKIEDNGSFSRDIILLDGENKFLGKVKDSAGNESQSSKEYKVLYDAVPPEIEILEPKDGQTFEGQNQKSLQIKVKSNEEATITVNSRIATQTQNNIYALTWSLIDGKNLLEILARDLAGNETKEETTVTFFP